MSDRTVKEGESSSTNRTVRENSGETLREGEGAGLGGRKGSAWLPKTLAERFGIIEELPVRGSEADLYIVQARNGQRLVAKIYRRGIQPKEDVLKLLRRAEFDHAVQLEEYGEDDGHWWELIEYIEHSSLRALIDQEGPKLSDSTIRDVLCELNDALTHLHGLPIEHRDLKPDNVLVRTREPLDLVLADFGISSVMEEDASVRFTNTARTIKYGPPESIGSLTSEEGKHRNIVAIVRTRWDYWSLGMILVEMLTGVHPYKGLSEAAISHRLATQNVDDLVDGVEHAGWRKLCQGLLRRDPGKRWGSEQIKMWLEDEQDPRLTVEDEIAPIEQSVRGIDFNGRSFNTPESLGAALMEDWSKAESFWKRRFQDLQTWIIDTLGQQDRGKALAAVDKDQRRKIDAQIFSLIYILAPSAPLQFKGVGLSPENLELIAKQAAGGDQSARSTLLSLYENDILPLAGAHNQGKGLATIARNWREAVSDYRNKLQDVERNGAHAPALEGDMLVKLLAAAVPVSVVVNDLKAAAQRATTTFARECLWFRNLGDPDNATIGAIMIIPHVIPEAEAGAKQRRYDAALKNFGVPARFLLGSAGGLVGGIVTAIIPGAIPFLLLTFIFGEKNAYGVMVLWVIGCTLFFGLYGWINLQRLVGNETHDYNQVQNKGIFYSIVGASTIAMVLFYEIPIVKSEYDIFAMRDKRRVAGLSARVWVTNGQSLKPSYRFDNKNDLVMHVKWIGNFVDTDAHSFQVIYPDGRTGLCPTTICNIRRNQAGFYTLGEYRIEARTSKRILATTTFTVKDRYVEGMPVEYGGQANGSHYSLRSNRWLSFVKPNNSCIHWNKYLAKNSGQIVYIKGPNNSYLFRSKSGQLSVEFDTVSVGQKKYGIVCH